jgi:hypothetical protein
MKVNGGAEDGDLNQDDGGDESDNERKEHYVLLRITFLE